MRDATVSDIFYKESKSKKIIFFFFFDVGGGGGGGAVVGEGGNSKRISLNKNVNKKMGGGGNAGVGRVRWGLEKVFFIWIQI